MTVEHVGCFGGATQVITIKEENGKRILSNNYTKGGREPERRVAFDIEKEKAFSDLIIAGSSISDSSFCTGQSTYKIETEKYKCVIQDNSCKLANYLDKLLE
ncbi:MAG: hypothetical protein IPP29_10545 [Bacteroidetes bacterium]|nr:hypothetical protein [Bacteroidota bacterium]